jgi:hypothetical protein
MTDLTSGRRVRRQWPTRQDSSVPDRAAAGSPGIDSVSGHVAFPSLARVAGIKLRTI